MHNIVIQSNLLEDQSNKIVLLKKLEPKVDPNIEVNIGGSEISLEHMNPEQWFYIPGEEGQRPGTLGKFYGELKVEDLQKEFNHETQNFKEHFQDFLSNYFQGKTMLELTYGDPNVFQRFVMRIFGIQTANVDYIQLIFYTQYFQSEHVYPLSNSLEFIKHGLINFHEDLHHLYGVI